MTDVAPQFAPISRVTLTRDEAAASLGISLDSFETYVQDHLRLVHVGRRKLVPVAELERWADRAATRPLPDAP